MPKINLFRLAALLLISLISSASELVAQETPSAPTRLALEITYYPGRKPAYQPVKQSAAQRAWAWYGMFARIDSWRAPAGSPLVRAVRITSYVEGDAVRVIVAALSGEKALENEQPVAKYLIRENEKINAEELRQFGIQPFGIKLIRVAPNLTPVPPVVLKGVDSLVVLNAVANDSTLPSYRISLFNQSTKNILALGVEVVAGGKMQTKGMPRGSDGQPLIEAGKVYELTVGAPNRARETPGGYEPTTLSDQEIQIQATVFDDGTFQGEQTTAATVNAFRAGEKMELSRLIPVLEKAMNLPIVDVAERLRTLELDVSAVSSDADPDTVQNVASGVPQLDKTGRTRIKGSLEVSSTTVRADLLKEIHRLQADGSLNESAYRAWLSTIKERYEKWLSRL